MIFLIHFPNPFFVQDCPKDSFKRIIHNSYLTIFHSEMHITDFLLATLFVLVCLLYFTSYMKKSAMHYANKVDSWYYL